MINNEQQAMSPKEYLKQAYYIDRKIGIDLSGLWSSGCAELTEIRNNGKSVCICSLDDISPYTEKGE